MYEQAGPVRGEAEGWCVTDIEIVRRVQGGDVQAFAGLVEKYHRPLLSFIARIVRDESSVEDLGQEVFLSVYRSLRAFDEQRSVPFAAWLFIAARNRCVSELRRRRGRVFVPVEEVPGLAVTGGTPEESALEERERQAVAAALEALPEPYRRVILGSLRGESVVEQARAEGIAPGTAKSRLSRARERMRELLGKQAGGQDHERT
jgi:RNA polymerase sigma-70 factor (ECF subfamily)